VSGTLYGVGLGPGDPELVTVKAARLIGAAQVIAYHCARHGRSIARAVAAPYLVAGQIEEVLTYPVTTEPTDHPGGYQAAMAEFYAGCAARLAAHLDAGRDVVVLAEGDPFFYGSYMHLHKRLAHRYRAEVVPGVTSVSAAAAALGRPLVEGTEVLTVLPGTLPPAELAERLAGTDAAAVVKLGRTFTGVREAFAKAGHEHDAYYVERATTDRQRTARLSDVDPDQVPYFSLALLPSPQGGPVEQPDHVEPAATATTAHTTTADATTVDQAADTGTGQAADTGTGEVVVVGLGPAGPEWLTPQAAAALTAADDLVGYGPYLDRVPPNPRQRRHPSDNREEAARAGYALDLALAGARVAVVSSGDPGVFAMATAVLEVAGADRYRDLPVRVLPGLTAAQAAASRVGAPLGHDYCVLSLSDRLKPWAVIEQRLVAAARADLAIAIYNPASRSRTHQLAAAREVLLAHRDPGTPVVIARDVGRPSESVRVLRLSELDPAEVDMRCLLLIGSSRTTVRRHPDGRATVFTPRHY
jgi:precorrin-2 C20-methyltransferase/precorrin-3B C17-methyltransferase